MPDLDPDEVKDYQINWSNRLGADTISTSEWTISPDGELVIGSGAFAPGNTETTATIWIGGGEIGRQYKLTNRIVTTGGRTYEVSIWVRVLAH